MTMTTIDEQLKKVISEDRIYTSKLIAHLDWYMTFKHLIVVTSIAEKDIFYWMSMMKGT